MQVTHSADHVTHAVIGGNKTIEFSISSDTAFFQILSSTLYSNQRLAVAREVLCNAWDAHIRAKKEDTAVIVTIDTSKIVVRDFGSGIHPDMMGPLYGTYGGTDKKNNGTETGGFGLGCKSPFAYVDHFEVISWHQGTKTVYNCSKSSADKFGKPGITTIVALPCGNETGLQVTIPLKTPTYMGNFELLFEQVAVNGEMNVNLNGKHVKGFPLSQAEANWIITNYRPLSTNHRVFVRYGNVIYPVEANQAYSDNYNRIISFLNKLDTHFYGNNYNIVFQAQSNTISVTPSRESLSMQEHTINTLKELLAGFFVKDFAKRIAKESHELLDRQILQMTEEKRIGELMTPKKVIPGLNTLNNGETLPILKNIADVAMQYTRRHYPEDPAFYVRDMSLRIEMAIKLEAGKRGHLNQVKKQIQKYELKHPIRPIPAHEWFKRRVVRPLVRDLQAHPMLDVKRLSILKEIKKYHPEYGWIEPARFRQSAFEDYLPILRNVLVITYSKKDLGSRINANPELKMLGGSDHIWVYHAPVAKTRIEATREFFKAKGFKIIDLTVEKRETWDLPKPVRFVDPNKPKKLKLTGYPALKGVYAPYKQARVDNCFLEGQPRVTNPKFFLYAFFSKAEFRSLEIGMFRKKEADTLVKLFGDQCAVVRTEPQRKKLKEEGLMELNEYVTDYVTKTVTTSPSFIAYWTEDLNRALGNKDGRVNGTSWNELLNELFDQPEIRKALGLKQHLNDHDFMVLSLWRVLFQTTSYYQRTAADKGKNIADASKIIELLPINQTITDITAKLTSNEFIGLLNLEQFRKITHNPNAKADGHLDRLAKIVKIALMG